MIRCQSILFLGLEGYLPESNERIAVIGANGAVLGLSTCTPASAVNLGIPIPQESPPTYRAYRRIFYPTFSDAAVLLHED